MASEQSSRVPAAVGALPLVGGLIRQADAQARWLQDVLEQNARLVGQLPATLRAFNDALERFNATVTRLDRMVDRIETVTYGVTAPLEQVTGRLERVVELLGELPGAGLVRRLGAPSHPKRPRPPQE